MTTPDPDKSLRRLQGSTASQQAPLSTRPREGAIKPHTFPVEDGKLLREAHSRAAYLGRVKAGDKAPFDRVDRAAGQRATKAQVKFLRGFRADLTSAEGYTEQRAKARAALYAKALVGTANESL